MLTKLSISSLPAIYFDGDFRVLGCLPSSPDSLAAFPKFGQHFATALDPSLWQEIDMSWYKAPIKNQKATSSCVAHASSSGMESCTLQSGRELRVLNPYFVYGLINGGRDAGAQISDAMTALMQYGDCPQEDLPAGVMFQNQFPQKAIDDAKRFRLAKAYHCPTFEDICSAITLGFFTPVGILVGQNFSSLDAQGVAPLPNGGGGGHCLLGVGLKKSTRYGWMIKVKNSWGENFGQGGYCYLHKGHFQYMNPDAFAIQSVIDDPQDTNTQDNVPVATN